MNSRVSVDAEEDEVPPQDEGGSTQESQGSLSDPKAKASAPRDGQTGNVVLVLPPKDNLRGHSSTDDDCIPIMVNNVPVFISHTGSGSPLYIRQYPPTLEEIMVASPKDLIANFDGFSETSSQTFEGFSEGSCSSVLFEGFSEASCSSVLFEGFSEEAHDNSKISVIENLGRIISESVVSSQADDLNDWYYEVPSEDETQDKPEALSSRRSSSYKRKRTLEKDSSDERQTPSTLSLKKVKKEEGMVKAELSINVYSRRQSTEKHGSESDAALTGMMGIKPRKMPSPDDPDYIGEYCNAIGCTVSFLERMAIKNLEINNGVIQELSDFASRISWEKEYIVRWIQRMSGLKTEESVEFADLKSIQAVLKRRKAISTIHAGNHLLKGKLRSFDETEYILPSVAKQRQRLDSSEGPKLESSEIINESDELVAHGLKKGHLADKNEEEQGGTRKGVKRLSDGKENDSNSDVSRKRISGGAHVAEIGVQKIETDLSSKVGETETRRRSTRDSENGKAKVKQEEKQFSENEKHEIAKKNNDETKTERRISTRRASMLALREEKGEETIKQERANDVQGKMNLSRRRSRSRSILLKHDQEEQYSSEMGENNTTHKQKAKEVHGQEGYKREDAYEDQSANKVVLGERVSTRRASRVKEREGKERAATEADEAKQTMKKTERTKNLNHRHRGELSNTSRSKVDKQQENERQFTEGSKIVQDCKTGVKESVHNESKSADERKKGVQGKEETEGTENHDMITTNKTGKEVPVGSKASNSRDKVLTRQGKGKKVLDMEEATETDDGIRERRTNKNIKGRGASPMAKQEVKEEKEEEKAKGTATKLAKTVESRRSSRRRSLLIWQEEGKKTTREMESEVIDNKKTSVRSGKETKIYTIGEGADKTMNSGAEEEKQTDMKEETNVEEESNQGKKQNSEETPPTIVTNETKKTEVDKVIEKEEVVCEETQFILKRNKVINRDKRISRWQNKKMAQHQKNNALNKEPSTSKDLAESSEIHEQESQQNTTKGNAHDESSMPSDDDSDDNMVIDEGDDVMPIDECNNSMESNLSDDTLTEIRTIHSDNEEALQQSEQKAKESEIINPQIESARRGPLRRQVRRFSREKTEEPLEGKRDVKGQVGVADTAKLHVTADGEDLECKEGSPQVTSPGTTNTTPVPLGTGSAYAGTLGVSKSGRLRKASAKGIQSIEIKCLFMQRNGEAPRPPPPLPASKDDQNDKDWVHDKRSLVKREPRDKDWIQDKRSPIKREPRDKDLMQDKKSPSKYGCHSSKPTLNKTTLMAKEKSHTFNKTDNEFLTYTYQEGHLIPRFRETDYYLGDYCAQAGVTVHDLNSEKGKKVRMTFGMIKELHDFYVSRKATKTALAIRLFKMQGKQLLDNTHLLSTVMRITNVAKRKYSKNVTSEREFTLPIRLTSPNLHDEEEEKSRVTPVIQNRNASKISPPGSIFPSRVRRSPKKRGVKPEDSGDEYEYFDDMEEEEDVYDDILLTSGQQGAITRGDIVNLYSKWLRSKMSQGSNTFVTDLLRSVEQLMAERQVGPLRIPAGTLMSSSVKLHDEYRQILRISKEDAIMYLQEDWLEDIKYLLSISGPSRRNTSEGEAVPGNTVESEALSVVEENSKSRTPRHRSGGAKEEDLSDFEDEYLSNVLPCKATVTDGGLRSHQMESVGKRRGKSTSIRESLDKFEKEILMELEKEGVLEEDEEDILQKLDKKQQDYEDQLQEKGIKEKKIRSLEDKGTSKGKGVQQQVTRVKKQVKPLDEGGFDCEVQKIMDYQEIHDDRGKHFRYLVRWVGFGPQDDSWVDEANLQCPEILQSFWKHKKSTRLENNDSTMEENSETKREREPSEPESLVTESGDEEESIIQVMVKHRSAHDTTCTKSTPVVTKRELLSLYDAWRQENQDELMAGSSNTINVKVFKERVKDLMSSRGIKFHPESLLNACFMMTLMKTRLQSTMAINKFLDTSCLEVLESSQRQYLKRKYSQIGEVLSNNHLKKQKPSISTIQNELHKLKLDLTTAHKWRAVKNSLLGAMEEEVDCLETAVAMPDSMKKTESTLYFKQELHKLRCDLKGLERNYSPYTKEEAAKAIQVPLFSDVKSDTESFKANSNILREKLLNMNIAKSSVSTIMNIVAQRVGGQCVQE